MQHTTTHSMAFVAPLIISLLLIIGEEGVGWHGRFADAATTASPKPDTRTAYWEAVLPGVPVPPAISDLLAQHDVLHSPDGFTISRNNLKSVKGLRKFGPNYEKVKSEPDHGDKHAHITSQAEDDLKEISMSYGSSQAHRPETEENLKEISVSYGLGGERDTKKVLRNLENILAAYRPQKQESLKEISLSYGSKVGEDLKGISVSYELEGQKDLKEISVSYGLEGEKDLKEISMSYGVEGEKDLKEISMSYGVEGEKDLKEISVSYGVEGEKDLKEISMSYGVEGRDVLKEISMSYGAEGGDGVKEISMSYGIEKNKNPMEVKASYGTEQERNLKEISVSYGSAEGKHELNDVLNQAEEDPNKATMSYGSEQEDDPNKATMSYGSEQEDDPNKATMSYGSEQEDDPNKATMSYGSEQEEDPHKATMSYGSEQEEDPHKITMSYGSEQEEDPHKVTMSYGSEQKQGRKTISSQQHETHVNGEGGHHHHAHRQGNKRQLADVFFFHDMLRPGSIITPTIPPTTSLPTLLPRDVASSIPFSTERLSDIIPMFGPASLSMAREIRWTLDTCKRPGKKAGCATSLESLAELPASLLRTRNVRAFSAADLPVEAPGTRAQRGRYNVTAVRTISGQSSEVVTCHDLTYPYAVYYCHTSTPTAAYAVTLGSVEEGAAPEKIEVLAVCHLDTSKWSPKNPFFELHNLKPGEVTVCHFLNKLSIIWVPTGEQGDAHATAR